MAYHSDEQERPTEPAAKLLAIAGRIRSGYRKWGLVLAVVVFSAGAVLTIMATDLETLDFEWRLLVAAGLVGVPLMTLLNAAEIRAAARAGDGQPMVWPTAIETAVIGTAANLLPIPGGTLVRVEALTTAGATGRSALRFTVAIGTVWVALSAWLSGALLLDTTPAAGSVAFVLAVAATAGTWILIRTRTQMAWVGEVIVIETLVLLVTALRLWVIGHAIGIDPGFESAVVIAASYALASAVGVFPGGLGLREALSSGLGSLAGAAGSTGFALSTIDRGIDFVVHLPITVALVVRERRQRR